MKKVKIRQVKDITTGNQIRYIADYSNYSFDYYLGHGLNEEQAIKNIKYLCSCYDYIFHHIREGIEKDTISEKWININ